MKVLFATTNLAKIKFYATRLSEKGIDLVTLSDLGITQEVEETGKTPRENAEIKAKAYAEISGLPTIAMDDGLYFDDLAEALQPGVHVRRVGDKHLNDEEMITHYLELVEKYGKSGELKGAFVKGVAVVSIQGIQSFENASPRIFVNRKSAVIDEGYPLASIQVIQSLNKFKSELTREEEKTTMDIEQQPLMDFLYQAIQQLVTKSF